MHAAIFEVFEAICRPHAIRGAVLEIGATPDDSSLLNLPALAGVREKVGINKAGAARHRDFSILQADANAMTCFPDQCFAAVLCNAVLEHDRFFWKTLAEIRRVTQVGGEQSFREVFFAGMKDVVIRTPLVPPRIIGAGIRT